MTGAAYETLAQLKAEMLSEATKRQHDRMRRRGALNCGVRRHKQRPKAPARAWRVERVERVEDERTQWMAEDAALVRAAKELGIALPHLG